MRATACVVLAGVALSLTGTMAAAQPAPSPPSASNRQAGIVVPGEVALASLVTLGDGYIHRFADDLEVVANDLAVLAEDPVDPAPVTWESVRPRLAPVVERNVNALVWFALPDGTYWSVQQGKSSGNLSDRPYFPRLLAGETVVGTLVVSKATGRCSAIVAVPIIESGNVVGALGASVYLDQLSARLRDEMSIGKDVIFFSFDATPLLALEWDPQLIFVDPLSLGPEIRTVFVYMLSHAQGIVRYRWAGEWRTALFRHSTLTGWWYVLGVVGGRNAAVGPG